MDINAATNRSGHPEFKTAEIMAAIITPMFPMASFLEHNQTERTFASPSLNLINSITLITFAHSARKPMNPINSVFGVVGEKNSNAVEIATHRPIPKRLRPFSVEIKNLTFFVESIANRESP